MDKHIQENIREFVEQNPTGVIVIYGPTGCGKTKLSLEIAELIESEIISVDARQVYRGLDIWTGKITPDEMQWIPHHMLDIIDVTQTYSVVEYRDLATTILHDIQSKWKNPILCWGTGLYIDSLIFERNYPSIPPDWDLRQELEDFRVLHGNEALWNKLYEIDPTYANTLHHNDRQYIIRGIEVYKKSGRSKMEIQNTPQLRYDTLFITPYDGDRERLYEKINQRVWEMFNSWLIEETRYILDNLSPWLLQNCYNSPCPWLATIGYAEVVEYIEWKISLDECKNLVKQHNRNYAKRQITWNKKYGEICASHY